MITTTTQPAAGTAEEKYPYKHLIRALKAQVKADAADIRGRKTATREAQRSFQNFAVAQSSLSYARSLSRARQLVYGLLRGITWERMEPNHPTGCADDPRLKHLMKKAWVEATASLEIKVGVPDFLKPYVAP